MRVSTAQMYQVPAEAVGSGSAAMAREIGRIASGRSVDAVSQDVAAVSQASRLTQVKARTEVHGANLAELDMRYAEADLSLSAIGDALLRMGEALARSRNGALADDAQNALSTGLQMEAQAIVAELGRRDSQGRQIYSGGVADPAHPALEVRPGQTLPSEVTLGAEQQAALEGLIKQDWVMALASSNDAQRAAAAQQVEALRTAVVDARGAVGARWSLVGIYQDANQGVADAAVAARSSLMDTDLAQAASDLATYSAQLQAARSMFGRIESTSLFDLIR
ncbi:flagellin [Hydrogenophaga sp.]|uniref:flagellin n=1 Tax=Hydrogenophaga sp. TaxID=1904254 RepID=UPI003F6B5915